MILQSDETKLITLHWVFLVLHGQAALTATGTVGAQNFSRLALPLFNRKHKQGKKCLQKCLF